MNLQELTAKRKELEKLLGLEPSNDEVENFGKNKPIKAPNGELILPPGYSGKRLTNYIKKQKNENL